jgi:hypothetical protein
MEPTNFPAAGDNKSVSLRNSDYARFDVAYALSLKEKFPRVWRRGGNIKGNAQFEILSRVARQGGVPKTRAEEQAVRLREAWAARHFKDHRINGVVAQIKWLVVGEQGEAAMKKIVEEQKQKDGSDGRGAASAGANRGGETRDLAQRPERRGGDEGESPLYVQQALVRAVRREKRPTAKNPEREVVVVEFVASTEIIDSHDSIVRSNWDLTRYTKNPVLIWMHGRMNDLPAVGNVENLQKVGSTKHEGNAVFDDTTEFDRAVAAKYEKGVLKGFSIGFYPRTVQWERIDGEEVVVLDDIEILEISCVNVPSNPEALAKADRAALAEVEARATTKWERALARMSGSIAAYEALHARALAAKDATMRGAVPYASHPLNEGKWDASAAEKRVATWATKDGEIDWRKYAQAFAWVEPDKADEKGGYKLPHHDIVDGKLVTVKAGVIAAGNAIQGARGGVKIPDSDLGAVKAHLAKHYKEFGLTPPWEEKAANNHGDTTMKDLIITERDVRATKGGVHCEAPCPNCNEKMGIEIKHSALDTDESAKKAAEFTALTTRATTAETRAATAEKLAETRAAEVEAANARSAAMERTLNETRQYIVADRIRAAEKELNALSGEKIFPTEIAAEMKLASRYLADLEPSKDDKHKGRSVGEVEWEERLATIKSRPSLRLLTPPQTQGGGNGEKTRETDPKVAGAMDQHQAHREAAVSAEIDSAGKNILASMLGNSAPAPSTAS